MFKKIGVWIGVIIVGVMASVSYAQESPEQGPVIYESPTIKNLSQLYWSLSKFKPDENGKIDDIYIDNFLFINECSLYQEFSDNEFEWVNIRESARNFLEENKSGFPLRFEYTQPLRLAEYDLESQTFDVWEPYKINGIRRFEILAEDLFEDICNQPAKYAIEGYPKGLFAEMNRPFTLETIKTPPEIAETYIKEKMRGVTVTPRRKEEKYNLRDAYLVMKIRFFSYQEEVRSIDYVKLTKVLAVLEGYEIYGDQNKAMLLFSENFKRRKKHSNMEEELKKRYQERLKKQMEKKKKALQEPQESAPIQ